MNFGSGTPRLFHFVSPSRVDITTSVDPGTGTMCGPATSFSRLAIFVSPIRRTGFYSPVSPVTGCMNTVKGGSTVPLTFNVHVGGVEKTDTAGLLFSVVPVGCAPAAEDPVDYVTTGGTSLRYDTTARRFVQNWQTPNAPSSCYLVRMTTVANGRSINALFKMK